MMLTPRQVADELSVSPQTVKRLIKSHKLGAIHIGRSVRISESVLSDFIELGGSNHSASKPTDSRGVPIPSAGKMVLDPKTGKRSGGGWSLPPREKQFSMQKFLAEQRASK
jgi:excisionase family DNA binding protein